MRTFRKDLIDSHIGKLKFAVRNPALHGPLRALHAAGKYTEMVGVVKNSMRLPMRLRVGLVNGGGSLRTPAWIECPIPMPPYGSREFERTLITLYMRKDFLREIRFEATVAAIAHELSHVVLFATMHELQEHEEAVDLTAMILGYRDFYRIASNIDHGTDSVIYGGYLTPDEITYAANLMASMQGDSS